MNQVLKSALHYYDEGLCVIPIVYRDKKPALDWEIYHTRRSSKEEIVGWFGNGKPCNLGIVHGEVSGGYIAVDVDKDKGVFDKMRSDWPDLFTGRVEQSGSLQGFHIPLRLSILPDFGTDHKHNRPRGNKTWKTELGDVNIRARFCQTLAPPSIHPTGNRYRFIQKGSLAELYSLDGFIRWLDNLAPPKAVEARQPVSRVNGGSQPGELLDSVLQAYPDVMTVFELFGMATHVKNEPNGEYRLLGNGGLLVTEDKQKFYSFREEIGGGIFEAWGMIRFGQYDKHKHFRQVLVEMAEYAGIEVNKTAIPEQKVEIEKSSIPKLWTPKYKQMWEFAR